MNCRSTFQAVPQGVLAIADRFQAIVDARQNGFLRHFEDQLIFDRHGLEQRVQLQVLRQNPRVRRQCPLKIEITTPVHQKRFHVRRRSRSCVRVRGSGRRGPGGRVPYRWRRHRIRSGFRTGGLQCETCDLLRRAAVEQAEVLLAKASHRTALGIADHHPHRYQVGLDPDFKRWRRFARADLRLFGCKLGLGSGTPTSRQNQCRYCYDSLHKSVRGGRARGGGRPVRPLQAEGLPHKNQFSRSRAQSGHTPCVKSASE